jgi:hypothetical protein
VNKPAAAASAPNANCSIRAAGRSHDQASASSTSCVPRPRPFARGWTKPIADGRDPVLALDEPGLLRAGQPVAKVLEVDLRGATVQVRLVRREDVQNRAVVGFRDRPHPSGFS